MAKQASEKGEQKANLYLLAIVAIVAVVGIVVLVLNSGGVSVSSDDLSGQVVISGMTGGSCANVRETCQGGRWQYHAYRGKCVCIVNSVIVKTATTTTGYEDPICGGCFVDPVTLEITGEYYLEGYGCTRC